MRTIKDEYLIAMKIVSARKYKNDYSDIYGIIKENPKLTLNSIQKALVELYGPSVEVNNDMVLFLNSVFNDDQISYEQIQDNEKKEKETLVKRNK